MTNNETTYWKDPRTVFGLILLFLFLAIIIFFFLRYSKEPSIRVNPEGFVDGIVLNLGIGVGGTLYLSTPDGEVVKIVNGNNSSDIFPIGNLNFLRSISIAGVASESKEQDPTVSEGILDNIFSKANATHYQGYAHILDVAINIDGQNLCRKLNISGYPPNYTVIGPCG